MANGELGLFGLVMREVTGAQGEGWVFSSLSEARGREGAGRGRTRGGGERSLPAASGEHRQSRR